MSRAKVSAIFERLSQSRPDPRTELEFSDAYTLLVAVVLSAQATDVGVNKATRGLFEAARTPAAMIALGEAGVAAHIRTIGLWRNKAKNIIGLSKALLDRHGGEVPADRHALEALPGVGRKTANVVLSEAFGVPTIAVDTHVFRVARRLGLSRATTPDAVEKDLMAITPVEFLHGAHHWLILHGRYVCKARNPQCGDCVLAADCAFRKSSVSAKAP
jgi:endonuclease-3